MSKKAAAVFGLEMGEAGGDGALEISPRACGRVPQVRFEFREGQLDGIEIRAVGGQIAHARPAGLDERGHRGGLVDAEIIEDDDVTRREFGTEHLADVSGEYFHIGRAFDEERSVDALEPQGRDEGRSLPVAMRHGANTTASFGAAPIKAGHLRVECRLVDEDQPPLVPVGLLPTPQRAGRGHVRPVLLGGARGFFYSSTPSGPSDATGH